MKSLPARNTYMSITIFHYDNPLERDFATIYTSVENVKLNLHSWVSYRDGQKELARLMLRLGRMPEVRRHEDFTCYELHGFLD